MIDTNVLVALADERDALNEVATHDLEFLRREHFVTTVACLAEATFGRPHPRHRRRMREILLGLRATPIPLAVDVKHLEAVFTWLDRYAEHEPDWADGEICVLCSHNRKLKVWTYDHEFRTVWRRLDGSAIPLVIKPPRS